MNFSSIYFACRHLNFQMYTLYRKITQCFFPNFVQKGEEKSTYMEIQHVNKAIRVITIHKSFLEKN